MQCEYGRVYFGGGGNREVRGARDAVPPVVEVAGGGGEDEPIWANDYDGDSWGRHGDIRGEPGYEGPLDLHPHCEDVGSLRHGLVRSAQRYNPADPYRYIRYGQPLPLEEAVFEVRDVGGGGDNRDG